MRKPAASLIKTVPSGLRHVGVPTINKDIINALAPELPVSVIVLLLEHIAISKSFGRVNNYKIVPNQELIAIGVTNLIGIFFSAYPATGSFSRSALKAKCGVRTPLAGIFTGAVVLLALYAFTDAFYWIPNATLCAIIIHAVYDLMACPKTSYKVWTVSPVEAGIFIIAVFITVFVTIEAGIYFSICASAAFLLFRIAKAKGEFPGVELSTLKSSILPSLATLMSSLTLTILSRLNPTLLTRILIIVALQRKFLTTVLPHPIKVTALTKKLLKLFLFTRSTTLARLQFRQVIPTLSSATSGCL